MGSQSATADRCRSSVVVPGISRARLACRPRGLRSKTDRGASSPGRANHKGDIANMTESTLGTQQSTAVIDNGTFGTREITFSTGRLARQAAGTAVARLGD